MSLLAFWGLEIQAEANAPWSGVNTILTLPVELVIMGFIALVSVVWTALFWERSDSE